MRDKRIEPRLREIGGVTHELPGPEGVPLVLGH